LSAGVEVNPLAPSNLSEAVRFLRQFTNAELALLLADPRFRAALLHGALGAAAQFATIIFIEEAARRPAPAIRPDAAN
jgi:hypothetical protein